MSRFLRLWQNWSLEDLAYAPHISEENMNAGTLGSPRVNGMPVNGEESKHREENLNVDQGSQNGPNHPETSADASADSTTGEAEPARIKVTSLAAFKPDDKAATQEEHEVHYPCESISDWTTGFLSSPSVACRSAFRKLPGLFLISIASLYCCFTTVHLMCGILKSYRRFLLESLSVPQFDQAKKI